MECTNKLRRRINLSIITNSSFIFYLIRFN
nr:MAG TPA: hypothetical protein [Caudoviricetes sp.]